MRSIVLVVLAFVLLQPAVAPDLVIFNARVFTGVATQPWVEAVAIGGERITAVGTTDAVRKLASVSTRQIDAAGRLIIPGMNDAHVHVGASPPSTRLEGPPAMTADPPLDVVLDSAESGGGEGSARGLDRRRDWRGGPRRSQSDAHPPRHRGSEPSGGAVRLDRPRLAPQLRARSRTSESARTNRIHPAVSSRGSAARTPSPVSLTNTRLTASAARSIRRRRTTSRSLRSGR